MICAILSGSVNRLVRGEDGRGWLTRMSQGIPHFSCKISAIAAPFDHQSIEGSLHRNSKNLLKYCLFTFLNNGCFKIETTVP